MGDFNMPATNARAVRFQALEDDERLPSARDVTAEPVTLEAFVPAQEAAKFVGVPRRFLLELARRGIPGAYPLGTGQLRKIWVFRLSELAAAIGRKNDGIRRQPLEAERAYHPIIRRSPLK
jgi:hypothetical protein